MDANTPSNLHHFTQVVAMDAKRNGVIDMLEFPKLKRLVLNDLSNFKSFRSESNNDGIIRTLFNQVTLPNMEKLRIWGLQYIVKLVNMRAENSSKSLQNLKRLDVKDCKSLEVLFDFECLTIPKDHRVFENLTSIVVKGCGILKYLFSPSMAYSLVALNILEVSNCESIKAIVGKEEKGTSEIQIVEAMKTRVVFPKLDRLLLRNLSSIQMFCSQNCELEFPLLEDLIIENCRMMRKLSPWPVIAPKLDISDLLDKAGSLED
ncbi:Hypothetical predicted protein [Olea europaea subsp. europaea]|uniref:Disease resistance protein At4g27190-like leucine-rich repeats domain-containing protein n=2 Tax=Olea europaea subsp. europaea TaxID=158383 RepID=A0A8S0UCQ9_OLEEU|nr:Hypothetical predicted protein [Olea europaea subsp. europaea]